MAADLLAGVPVLFLFIINWWLNTVLFSLLYSSEPDMARAWGLAFCALTFVPSALVAIWFVDPDGQGRHESDERWPETSRELRTRTMDARNCDG